jgi:hypothetical protein
MGSGYCSAVIWQTTADDYGNAPDGTFAMAVFANYESGYTRDLWIERNVNDTGWYRVGGVTAISKSGSTVETGHYYNGGGYQARACFQFNRGSSLGAVHCSGVVKYEARPGPAWPQLQCSWLGRHQRHTRLGRKRGLTRSTSRWRHHPKPRAARRRA